MLSGASESQPLFSYLLLSHPTEALSSHITNNHNTNIPPIIPNPNPFFSSLPIPIVLSTTARQKAREARKEARAKLAGAGAGTGSPGKPIVANPSPDKGEKVDSKVSIRII